MAYDWDYGDAWDTDYNIPGPDPENPTLGSITFTEESVGTEPTGFSSDYYQLPDNATELQDLIEYKEMNFALGNIFKACYRCGSTKTPIYDLEKILWFAERELERLHPEAIRCDIPEDATEEDIPAIADRIAKEIQIKLDKRIVNETSDKLIGFRGAYAGKEKY